MNGNSFSKIQKVETKVKKIRFSETCRFAMLKIKTELDTNEIMTPKKE